MGGRGDFCVIGCIFVYICDFMCASDYKLKLKIGKQKKKMLINHVFILFSVESTRYKSLLHFKRRAIS